MFDDESKAGACLWVPSTKPTQFWPTDEEKKKYRINPGGPKKIGGAPTLAPPPPIPVKYQKV